MFPLVASCFQMNRQDLEESIREEADRNERGIWTSLWGVIQLLPFSALLSATNSLWWMISVNLR